jgi:hypothetical protein
VEFDKVVNPLLIMKNRDSGLHACLGNDVFRLIARLLLQRALHVIDLLVRFDHERHGRGRRLSRLGRTRTNRTESNNDDQK